MPPINKEYLKNAFVLKKGKRRQLLYEYYKRDYFSNPAYSADFIADAISKDLDVPIDRNLIYQINARIAKKDKLKTVNQNAVANAHPTSAQGKNETIPKEWPKFNFRNAQDIPEEKDRIKQQLDKAFKGL